MDRDIHEFHHLELEALKERIANEMGFELVGHRLELYGRRLALAKHQKIQRRKTYSSCSSYMAIFGT